MHNNHDALHPLAPLAQEYLNCLLEAHRQEAFELIQSAIENGTPVTSIYLDVLQPALYEVGRLWQINKIDIAVEHYCTAATQLLLSQLFPYMLEQKRIDKSMIGCCLGSELHVLGMRMVSDFFEYYGWDTYFMGAQTPQNSIAHIVEIRKPDVLCLSATMAHGIPQARDVIADIRGTMNSDAPTILVGGLAFNINPSIYKVVGADGVAANAMATVKLATQLQGN